MHTQGLSNLGLLKKLLVTYVKLDRRKDKYIYMCASFFRLEFRERGAL